MIGRRYSRISNQKGFSLVEVLLALVIGTIIIGAVYLATVAGHNASSGIEQKISVQQDARAALDMMALEIGMVSYNPSLKKSIVWLNSNCEPGIAADKGIQSADGNKITVEMDLDGSGTIMNIPNEIITYTYRTDGNNRYITRETSCGGGQAFLGDRWDTPGSQQNVRVINQDLNIPVFTYFDSQGNPTADIAAIRRIDITLAAEAADPDARGQRRRMIYSTSVVPRNHAVPPVY